MIDNLYEFKQVSMLTKAGDTGIVTARLKVPAVVIPNADIVLSADEAAFAVSKGQCVLLTQHIGQIALKPLDGSCFAETYSISFHMYSLMEQNKHRLVYHASTDLLPAHGTVLPLPRDTEEIVAILFEHYSEMITLRKIRRMNVLLSELLDGMLVQKTYAATFRTQDQRLHTACLI